MTWPMEECDHIKAMRKWLKTHGKLTDIEANMTLEEIADEISKETGRRVSTQRIEQNLLSGLHKVLLAFDAENTRLDDHLPVERKQPQPRAKEVRFPLEAEFWVGNSIFTKWGSI